jgi:hypothetical protein
VFGATLIVELLSRFRSWFETGAALLGWIAGELIVSDRITLLQMQAWTPALVVPAPDVPVGIKASKLILYSAATVGILIVLVFGWLLKKLCRGPAARPRGEERRGIDACLLQDDHGRLSRIKDCLPPLVRHVCHAQVEDSGRRDTTGGTMGSLASFVLHSSPRRAGAEPVLAQKSASRTNGRKTPTRATAPLASSSRRKRRPALGAKFRIYRTRRST